MVQSFPMSDFHALLLDVWREACRHIDIAQSTRTIARILAGRMPIERVGVLDLDLTKGLVVPRAIGCVDGQEALLPVAHALRPADRRLLHAWLRGRQIVLHNPGDQPHDAMRLLVGDAIDGSWLAAPLASEHGSAGALLLRARAPEAFDDSHVSMARLLIEPFSAAMENDRRLHELNALREAAEADKRSALSRLGRDDLVDTIVGSNGGLRAVMERVQLVARSDVPVLILGETGSGKEVIARAIHEHSPRTKAPFIRVNCGAIPPELIDSELFGHEKGAFTGATSSRRGWFERADQGTLLLDEVGELPLAAQVRLLRVLQEGTFERVGGEQSVRVNVRIIAATHRDLPAMVQQGRFREDLWYRIAAFPIVLPPLRERRQDIPALAGHFAERAARRFGLRPCKPTEQDLALLASYNWPGNIRELASVIDRAAILGEGEYLAIAQALGLPGTAAGAPSPTPIFTPAAHDRPVPPAVHAPATPAHPAQPLLTLDQAMRQHIETALTITRGRIEGPRGAARLLGINPNTLRSRMRKLGVQADRFR